MNIENRLQPDKLLVIILLMFDFISRLELYLYNVTTRMTEDIEELGKYKESQKRELWYS